VIPELERIIGKQAPATELSGTAAQNRFNLLFQKFIQVFTTIEHPLVMFLDDLQWADSASLNLMQLLMNESESHYLLMIGAYRDNEVSSAHPLMLTLDAVAKANATINTITLRPLSQGSLNQLVADTLNCHILSAQALTELIALKTKGNPFFATQFLKALYQDGLIQFDLNLGHWQCDLAEIRTVAVSDDVVEFMASQLQKLPSYTQDILKLAACIGAQFDLNTLAIVSQQSEFDAAIALWKALQSGLILPQSELYKFYVGELDTTQNTQTETLNYKFLHDRVQQAAYSLIPDDQKQITHLQMGQLLLLDASPSTKEEKLFDIVNHLNIGRYLMIQASERTELAQLNLNAGAKAKNSIAYAAARGYLKTGIELLQPDCWKTEYELALNLHVAATEASYLNGDYEGMEHLAVLVLQQAQTIFDKVKIYEIQIAAHSAHSQMLEAIAVGRNALAQLGVELVTEVDEAKIAKALQYLDNQLQGRVISELIDLPVMSDPVAQAAMQLLTTLFPPIIQGMPGLLPLLSTTMVRLSIQFGNAPTSTVGYVIHGMVLCAFLGKIETGSEFGSLALSLLERFNVQAMKSITFNLFAAFIQHHQQALRATILVLKESYSTGMETGGFLYAGYAIACYAFNAFFAGVDLETLDYELIAYSANLAQVKQNVAQIYVDMVRQTVEHLRETVNQPDRLIGTSYDETVILPKLHQNNDFAMIASAYLYKLLLAYYFGNYQAALDHIASIKPCLMAISGMTQVPTFHFYAALTHLAFCPTQSEPQQAEILDQAASHESILHHWAQNAPMNYQHKVDLLEAEKYRVLGKNYEAGDCYDRAISGAKANEYIQEEALANELAAKFYLNWGKEKVAAGYMQEAYYCYAHWGAKAKTDDLENRYPHLLCPILQQSEPSVTMLGTLATIATPAYSLHSSTHKSSSSSSINTTLDFATILKASQALARSLQLEDLLYQLTQIILQNSGGDHCALILPNENQVWEVRAIATPSETELCTDSLENNPNVPVKLIQYVKNTQKVVVFDDLETDLPVISDYLRQQQPKSVLCLPILNQGNLVGIVYLQNRLTSGVFTNDRIIILDFLYTQVAISLENARLYNQVKQTLTDLQQAQLKIVQSEKMSALGNLVAGVAHEINNPVGCIIGNVDAVQNSINDLFGLIDLYNEQFPQPGTEIEEELETIDLEYLRDDLPKLIRAMKDGGDRIKSISKSLRTFSRADSDQKQTFNLHEGIDSTILILRHRLKASETRPAIEVATNYGNIPAINCFPGQLNQVFMNILANAIDALDESNNGRSFEEIKANPNCITITTSVENHLVKMALQHLVC
jgi:predicted ATPase/GAF domain-containing protein